MTTKSIFITALLSLLLFSYSIAQDLEPVKWKFSVNKLNNNKVELVFKASIEKKWHLYSQFVGEGGPLPTEFIYEKSDKYKVIDKAVEYPKPEKHYDSTFLMDVLQFTGMANFKQKVELLTDEEFVIKGEIAYMSCDDERCIPLYTDFSFNISPPEPEAVEEEIVKDDVIEEEDIDSSEEEILVPNEVETADTDNKGIPEEEKEDDDEDTGTLWGFLILGLAFGFGGALTPCVYPMIPVTVNYFMNMSENKSKNRFHAIFYGISIIVIYTIVGVILGEPIQFISTHWITNLVFFILFIVFAASFFGMFEIMLPSSIADKTDKQADKGGLIGTFFMALTLIIVSFACTAPFIGSIIVMSGEGHILKPAVGMFGFAIAFALPFTFLAFFPALMGKMPKSGGWMNTLKVILGFLIIFFGFKFFIVPNEELGLGVTREMVIAIWIVLFTLLGLYLMGKIKLPHDGDTPHIKVPRLFLIIITFSFVVYLIPGLFGMPLNTLSPFLPPESSFDIPAMIRESTMHGGSGAEASYNICEKPKYSDEFKFKLGLKGYFDYNQAVKCSKELNKPVLLDFTGRACANCKKMEAQVWSDPEVLKRIRENFVLAGLYCDVRIDMPESEWVKDEEKGKVLKTMDRINKYIEKTRYNNIAQPYYAIIDFEGKDMADPRGYNADIEEYIKWLDEGFERFKKKHSDKE